MYKLVRVLISLGFIFSSFSISVAQPILNWNKVYDHQHRQESPNQVIVDDSGNIFIIGEIEISSYPSTNMDALILKYDPYGNLLWYRTHSLDPWGWDVYSRAMLTEEGNIFVTGNMQVGNTSRIFNIMYSAEGDTLWSDSPYLKDCQDFIFEDKQTNIKLWPPVYRYIFKQDSIFIVADIVIENNLLKLVFLKYNKEGQNLGMTYSPLFDGSVEYMDFADSSVLLTYKKANTNFQYRSVVQKIGISGKLEWETETTDTSLSMEPVKSIFGDDGSIYSTSSGMDGDTSKYFLTKLNQNGKIVWDSSYKFEQNYYGRPADLTILDSGKIKVVGMCSYWDGITSEGGAFIAIYDTSGNLLDFQRHPLPYVIQNYTSPKYDTIGNTYWSFGIQNTMGYLDILIIKIDQYGELEYQFVYRHNNNQTYNEEPMDMFVVDEDNYVVCARGSGLAEASNILTLRYGSTFTSIDPNLNQLVTCYSLEQNYPNPFNPGTTISWQSTVGSWQSIKMFNSLGQEVATIVDGYYEAGVHSKLYIVNSSLPSGVYFYQLKAGNYIETKKMILLK